MRRDDAAGSTPPPERRDYTERRDDLSLSLSLRGSSQTPFFPTSDVRLAPTLFGSRVQRGMPLGAGARRRRATSTRWVLSLRRGRLTHAPGRRALVPAPPPRRLRRTRARAGSSRWASGSSRAHPRPSSRRAPPRRSSRRRVAPASGACASSRAVAPASARRAPRRAPPPPPPPRPRLARASRRDASPRPRARRRPPAPPDRASFARPRPRRCARW